MKRNGKPEKRDVSKFPLNIEMSKPQRAAHFLDWWSREHPYDFVGYHELLKAIEGYRHTPKINSEEVQSLRHRSASAERVLLKKYNKVAVRTRGLGIRATVDDEDMLRNKQVGRVMKIRLSIQNAKELDKRIDLSKIQQGSLKDWYTRGGVRGILNQVGSEEQLAKLLPPKTTNATPEKAKR